jgi:DNA-binding response OmpR family regulator
MRILVVEDNHRMADMVCGALRDARYAVDLALDGSQAAELVDFEEFDLIVLDWMLPEISGLELLRTWRGQGHQLPILVKTEVRIVESMRALGTE